MYNFQTPDWEPEDPFYKQGNQVIIQSHVYPHCNGPAIITDVKSKWGHCYYKVEGSDAWWSEDDLKLPPSQFDTNGASFKEILGYAKEGKVDSKLILGD